jgi:hypothetical protein
MVFVGAINLLHSNQQPHLLKLFSGAVGVETWIPLRMLSDAIGHGPLNFVPTAGSLWCALTGHMPGLHITQASNMHKCVCIVYYISIYIYRDIIVRVFVCIYISILYILYTYVGILWLCISPSVKCYQRIIFIEDVIGSWKLSSLHRPPNNLSVYLLRNGLHL